MSIVREMRVELGGLGTRALELEAAVPSSRDGSHALVLLHGWGDSADTWRPLFGRLAERGRRAVALDLPGFGQAARLDREQPVLSQLDRFVGAAVAREAERSPTGRVVIAGNSLGGCAALRAAERSDLPLAGVVPIAPAGLAHARWFRVIEGERLVRLVLQAPFPLPESVVRDAVARVYSALAFAHPRAVDPSVVASFTRHLRTRRDVVRILATGRRLLPELADPFRLERVRCPVLLVWGDSDRMVFPTGAEKVLRAVSGARLEVLERCGHCPQIECPDRLAELLDGFATELAEAA